MWIKIFNRRYNLGLIDNYMIDHTRHGVFLILGSHSIKFDSKEKAEAEMKRLDDLLDVK